MSTAPHNPTGPLIDMPAKTPAALRAAVARLDQTALDRFDEHWTSATAQTRDEYSLMPARAFTEHWWVWVAVERWPELAARFRECERITADSEDRAERRAASAELGRILAEAEAAAA
ncbi:DUF6247 family protein [Streptomyces sp. NBC_01264]|uniref:DUF6247 family protein n=1 Tax=Streptomyces sp. NBC_01264 TaxID=2903804 RepID=UPI002252A629|nr:DUF6247 family protein [Streptomyces sp. NBC_01264]MCX4783594.1 hypothetical protein [Streptomyces sp. NBC_01264]